ncbi:leucyl aminopeptidase [Thermocrinis jamiesonii]|jgi:Leucyl aminopeptidase|uniref:leucyl aminopeptidase n=1 Tax=Thermocrinis jamiesonii TaxID=1302351 RepID=UPI0004962627|nr:leucyl aminopeptidase [Thermocrinis jamiesonii]
MEILSVSKSIESLDTPIAVLLYEDDQSNLSYLGDLQQEVKMLMQAENFKGKEDSVAKINLIKNQKVVTIYLGGLGKKEKVSLDNFRRTTALIIKRAKRDKVKDLLIYAGERLSEEVSKAIVEGAILGDYTFDKYKTKNNEEEKGKISKIELYGGDERGITVGKILAQAQRFVRDLVNEPGNVINPITLAEIAKKLAEEYHLECRIYDEKEIQEMGMMALWSVGKGSATPPRFIHLTYRPEGEPKDRIVFVGKGLTFDSGGLNIKTGDYMRTMKMDKAGACTVLGILKAVAELKLPVEVHGVIGAAENMPSGTAYRPDDIIRAMNGKTIEIDNTDAEGRVTLADALSYASNLEPSRIIDLATLTGACVVALGEYTAGLFTNDDEFGDEFLKISKDTGERLWKLPMDDKKLREKIKKGDGDVLNSGGRYGGAITAAMFLEEFVKEGIKWIHLDIAGPAYFKEEFGYYSKGATGFGLRTCVEYIIRKYS